MALVVRWTLMMCVVGACPQAILAAAQKAWIDSAAGSTQANSGDSKKSDHEVTPNRGTPDLRVESKLVVVRVVVADKTTWRNGPTEAGQQCALRAENKLLRISTTDPYLPPDCEGVFIRGLQAKDFHLLVDGKEQKIERVISESEGLQIRDNLGLHNEFSQTPAGIWSATDFSLSSVARGNPEYGLMGQNRYDLSFVPQSPSSVGCHKVKVKVNRRNTFVAARDEYCDMESPSDILSGNALGDQLQRDLSSGQAGEIPILMQVATFETEKTGGGRAHIALEFPARSFYRRWSQDWALHATIGVLGVVYRRNGTVAARFSDFACCTPYSIGAELGTGLMTMNRLNALTKQVGLGSNIASKIVAPVEKSTLPTRYEVQLDLPPGEYDLQVALSDGRNFGRAEAHVEIEDPLKKELTLSSVMLCGRSRSSHVAEVEREAANFAPQYTPTVSKAIELTPVGDTTFSPRENMFAYFEIYEPQIAKGSVEGIQAHLRIIEVKSGVVVKDFTQVDAASYEKVGSRVIAIARDVPIAKLLNERYRLEVKASDANGRITVWRRAEFSINDQKSVNPTTGDQVSVEARR